VGGRGAPRQRSDSIQPWEQQRPRAGEEEQIVNRGGEK
jgi:hypothetical protein